MDRNVAPCTTQSGFPPLNSATEYSIPEMFSNYNTYPGSGPTADVNLLYSHGYGLAAEQTQAFANPNDMSRFGAPNLAQILGVFLSSSTFHQHQPLPHENQELIAGGYPNGANGNAGTMIPGTLGDTGSDGRTVTLHWTRADGTQARAQVQATYPVYDPMTRTWPPNLQLIFGGGGIHTINIQSWLHNKDVPGENNHDFDELVRSLSNFGGFATASWDVGGRPQILFAPLNMDLLCASFPMGIPELPIPHSPRGPVRHVTEMSKWSPRPAPVPVSVAIPPYPERPCLDAMDGQQNPQPQRWSQPQADYPPPETMEHPQGGPNLFAQCSQMTTGTPVRAASPPRLQLGPQAYTQGPLEPSQTHQSLEMESQDTVIAASELDGWCIDSALEEDASTGSVADTSTLGFQASGPPALQTQPHFNMPPMFALDAQPFAMQDQPVFLNGSGNEQRQQLEYAHTTTLGLQASGPPALQTQPHFNMPPMFALGAQPFAMQDHPVFLNGSDIEQRPQPIQLEDAQTLIADGPVLGANRTTDPILPGAFGGIAGGRTDSWTGTLWWQYYRDGDLYQVQGVATDEIHNPMFSIWPSALKIQLVKTAISTLDVQAWILKNRTPVARIKGKPGDRHQFDNLVKSLRSSGCYALVDLEMGSFQLLLVPLNEDLLCALFDSHHALPKPRFQPGDRPKAVSTLKHKQWSSSKAM